MDSKEFGQIIKKMRKEKSLTLLELGDKIGFSKAYLSIIENGKNPIPRSETIKKLANGLDVSFMWLMELAGHTDHEYYIDEIWEDESFSTREVTVDIPDRYSYKDPNGVKTTQGIRSEDELKSWLFDLDYLLNAKINLYHKGNKLSDQDKQKIKTMLQTILE